MKILCVFGKYQYGDPSLGIGTEYAAFIPALKKLGHEVLHFESWNRSYYSNYADLNLSLLKTVEKESPDLLLSVQMNYEIWLETLKAIKDKGDIITICWTTDDSWKYKEVSRFIGKAYHCMTTTYPEVIPKYYEDGIPNVFLTQWAANSEDFMTPLPAEKCRYQISFIGSAHGDRKRRISLLQKHGIHVSCFGNGWPAGPIPAKDISGIINKSIISLNFANSKGQNQIKARTFEVPGAGGFLLTENAPGLNRYYTIGKEIDTFNDTNELIKKINLYLADFERRDLITNAGFERTVKENTYELRMMELIEFAKKIKKSELPMPANKSNIIFDELIKCHQIGLSLKLMRNILLLFGILLWGKKRGPRAARRFIFEVSWRLFQEKTYSCKGWPGRIFPDY